LPTVPLLPAKPLIPMMPITNLLPEYNLLKMMNTLFLLEELTSASSNGKLNLLKMKKVSLNMMKNQTLPKSNSNKKNKKSKKSINLIKSLEKSMTMLKLILETNSVPANPGWELSKNQPDSKLKKYLLIIYKKGEIFLKR
jgi:fructose-1,6-bisphosphatase